MSSFILYNFPNNAKQIYMDFSFLQGFCRHEYHIFVKTDIFQIVYFLSIVCLWLHQHHEQSYQHVKLIHSH